MVVGDDDADHTDTGRVMRSVVPPADEST
jgi:hypothetical protein